MLHLDPGCLQASRVGLRNYFYTSVRACNMQGVICIIPLPPHPSPKPSTNTSASWNFFFLSLLHSISRSRMLFNHQVSPFATYGSKPFLGSGAKGSGSRWCGRLFVLSSSFITCIFALRSLCAVRGAAGGFPWAEAGRLPQCPMRFGIPVLLCADQALGRKQSYELHGIVPKS